VSHLSSKEGAVRAVSAPKFLTAEEVAERLRTSPITVVRLCRDKKLPATKPAGKWLINEADLEAHLASSRNDIPEAS
jgi:excisionase family DNA binding protein